MKETMSPEELLEIGIRQGQYPQYLFRYTNTEIISTLKEHYLWFSDFGSFNDPFDGKLKYPTNYSENDLESYLSRHANKEAYKDAINIAPSKVQIIVEDGIETVKKSIKVCCFTRHDNNRPDDILQWAYYADAHKGICMQFDILKDPKTFSILLPIIYADDYPTSNYLIDEKGTINNMVRTKARIWQREKEYRIVKYGLNTNKVSFTPKSLTRIYLGCKMDREMKVQIQAITKKTYPSTRITEVATNEAQYKLDFFDL